MGVLLFTQHGLDLAAKCNEGIVLTIHRSGQNDRGEFSGKPLSVVSTVVCIEMSRLPVADTRNCIFIFLFRDSN